MNYFRLGLDVLMNDHQSSSYKKLKKFKIKKHLLYSLVTCYFYIRLNIHHSNDGDKKKHNNKTILYDREVYLCIVIYSS